MATHNQYDRIVPFILFILGLFLLLNLIRPMITIILGAILLAYLSYPLVKVIRKKVTNESFSIILSLFFIVLVVLIPFAFLTFEIAQQGYYFYHSLSDTLTKGALFGFGCTSADSEICSLLNQAEKFSQEQLSTFGFDRQLQKILPILEEKITGMILSIPMGIARVFLTLVITYFILKGWKELLKKMADILPMRKKTLKRLFKEFGNITHTVIYAQLFVALVQGVIATIGYYLFGVPFPLFLGVLTAFLALIPTVGTAMIWFPASLLLIGSGYFSHEYVILAKGIGLLLYGLLIVSTIDNILLAKIVHAKAKVNQIIVIIGVIGGASMFGIVGIFIGPILLPLLLTYLETFKDRFSGPE